MSCYPINVRRSITSDHPVDAHDAVHLHASLVLYARLRAHLLDVAEILGGVILVVVIIVL